MRNLGLKNLFRKLGGWIRRHAKTLLLLFLAMVVIAATAAYAYQQGEKAGKKAALKQQQPFASLFKNLPKQESATPSASSTSTTNRSSGFFRFNSTVQSVTAQSMVVKLENGSVQTLVLKSGQQYFVGKQKQPIASLKKGTTIVATGTIGADGAFNVTAIQVK